VILAVRSHADMKRGRMNNLGLFPYYLPFTFVFGIKKFINMKAINMPIFIKVIYGIPNYKKIIALLQTFSLHIKKICIKYFMHISIV